MAIKHGVFVYENDTALSAPITAESSVQVVIGAAPVWMLDDPAAVTNVPVLCTSAMEAMERLGYLPDFSKYTLCQTMYMTSNIAPVGPVVYINVLDVAVHNKTTDAATIGGSRRCVVDKEGVIKNTVEIKNGSTKLVADTDYTLEYDSEGKLVVNFIGEIPASASLTCTLIDTTKVTSAEIIGSYNTSTGVSTGAQLIDKVYPKLGVIPGIIIAPGFSQIPAVGVALAAKASNISGVFKAMAVVDIDTARATIYTNVGNIKNADGFTSPYCYPVWLSFKVGEYIFAGSAVVAAIMAYNDANNGGVPSRTPSNKLAGVQGTCLADGTEVLLTQDQATVVNSYGVATAINLGGWRLWGSYTGAYPSTTDVKDMWVPVRRMFNWQANTFILTYFDKVDDPLNNVLVESVVDSENIRCAAYTPDQWAGAEIQYLTSDNPVTDLLAGKVVFRQRIAPYTPAQEIDNILSYDTSLLANTLAGLV